MNMLDKMFFWILENHSKNGYKILGFNMSSMDDNFQDFIITTDIPIPFDSHGTEKTCSYAYGAYWYAHVPELDGAEGVIPAADYIMCRK